MAAVQDPSCRDTLTYTIGGSLDGRSNNSSSSDISRMDHLIDPNDPNRTHHLLKHCLSDGQRGEALAHFGSDDVKEAAKEISKMGQRDLQSKFRLVYGTATHSNNNDWLRRKLYEAIGAAPIKAATKAKPRKAASKARKTAPVDPLYHSSSAASVIDLAERRSRRLARPLIKTVGGGSSVAESLKRFRQNSGSLPGSPMVGRSVLDMHRYLGHDSATTSASEDDTEVCEEEETEERVVRYRASSDQPGGFVQNGRPISAFAAAADSTNTQLPSSLPSSFPSHMKRLAPQQRTSSVGVLGLAYSLNMEMFQATSDAWGSDAWADAALKAAAARQAPAAMPSVEDDDIMLLPMDLSAFDDDATALL